jgi:7,8-dihydropterin-6-yl-methyl-4-(beta-D-ribofuranosyl)aminobenzene 5'-phosphate synthase
MYMRARVLCENSVFANQGAFAEHGWSVWLETHAGTFLFDTGPGNTLRNNAAHFGIPLEHADGILISHHHYDHTGGLLAALRTIRYEPDHPPVPVYAHPDLFKDSFYDRKGKLAFVGVEHKRAALELAGAEFRLDANWREIASGIFMTGEVPRVTDYEFGDQNIKHYGASGEIIVDPVRDDQTVVIDTPVGMVVALGCSHAGLVNILTLICEKTGKSRIHTLFGGTHLGPVGADQVDRTIAALHQFDIERIGVSHCTGQKVGARMAHEFGDRFFFCNVGTVVEV